MPNVYLKNEIGEDVEYEDIDTVTLRRVEGGTATYTYGDPQVTDEWKLVESIVTGDARTNLFTKYTVAVPSGRIVSYTEPAFGTWYQSRHDARRISTVLLNQMFAVPGGAVLSNNSTGGSIYYWDDETKELVTLVSGGSPVYNCRTYAGKYFFASYGSWFLFDADTHEVTTLLTGAGLSAYCLDTGEELLLSASNTGNTVPKGIYRLDPDTLELTQIFNEGWYWLSAFRSYKGVQTSSFIVDTGDGYLISSYTSSAGSTGVLYFDKTEKTVTRLFNEGYYYFNEAPVSRYAYSAYTHIIPGCGVVFCSTQSSSWGVWYFDFETKQATRILQTGYMTYWMENDTAVVGSYTSFGAVVFDKAAKVWYHPVTAGQYDNALILENGILLGATSSSYGLKYYDFATEEVTTVSTAYNYWRYMVPVEGGALLSNSVSNTGVFFFDETELSLTQLNATGNDWYMVKWHDSVLMGSFNNSSYGWFFYKDGELVYTRGPDGNSRGMRCIVPVEDGWVISSYSYSSRVMFIDGETGEAKDLQFSANQLGPYIPYWYGHNGNWKPTYDYNRKYGRYRVISSYDGYGFIFDDIAHEAVPLYTWATSSEVPSTSSSKYVPMRRVAFIDLGNSTVLIMSSTSNNNGPTIFNYSTGTAYQFTNSGLYANNEPSYLFTPLIMRIPVGNGELFTVKPFDWDETAAMLTSAPGVWHYNPVTGRLQRIYASGYYDSTEEAPGGFYLFLSSLPKINRLYWNSDSNTISKVDY